MYDSFRQETLNGVSEIFDALAGKKQITVVTNDMDKKRFSPNSLKLVYREDNLSVYKNIA